MSRLWGACACLAALTAGAALGTGCFAPEGPCGEAREVVSGVFEITETNDNDQLLGATVDIDIEGSELEVSYSLEDGTNWVVLYEIAD